MDMMPIPMDLEDLPQQLSIPFPEPPLAHFPTTNHPTPPLLYRYPPPLSHQFLTLREIPRGTWLQQKPESVEAVREMIFRMAALQPVQIDPESIKPPKRRNVKISKDPQSVAARHRREKISERIRILQRLVPGGTKMDTASMLDEAAHYMKFLKKQVQALEQAAASAAGGLMPVKMAPPPGFNVVGCGPTGTAGMTMNHDCGSNHSHFVRPCGHEPASDQGSHIGSMDLLR